MDNMKVYIGCKVIKAVPMKLSVYKDKFNRVVPAGEYGEDGYHVRYPDGYDSWFPKENFERAYRELDEKEVVLIETA